MTFTIFVIVAILFVVSIILKIRYDIYKSNKNIENNYKNSDMYKKTRQDFIDKINKKGKK
jgi:cell division protein FtsL